MQAGRISDTPALSTTGNWREIQDIDQHEVAYVASEGKIS
jgi:hypothetical protein